MKKSYEIDMTSGPLLGKNPFIFHSFDAVRYIAAAV